jgi:hypothetical protein
MEKHRRIVTSIRVCQETGVRQPTEEHRGEARSDNATAEYSIDSRDEFGSCRRQLRLRRKYALELGREQRGWWTLPRDVSQDECECLIRQVKVVTEIATDGAAGQRRRCDIKSYTCVSPLRQKRLLDFGGDPYVMFQPCSFESCTIGLDHVRTASASRELQKETCDVVHAALVEDFAIL